MVAIVVRHVPNVIAMNAQLRSPTGGVMRDMLRRGYRVEAEAKRRVHVNTGRLRNSIHTKITQTGTELAVEIGSNLKYAMAVHNGTGVYGPYGMPIVARSGGVLRFQVKGQRGYVFSRTSQGQRPNPFLKEALQFARF